MNLADFAKHSYGPTAPRGYLIDQELSGPDRKVYHKDGKAIIAYRGTSVTNSRDLTANAGMGIGIHHKLNRFKHSVDIANRAVKKYGKHNVTITGHSLGGSQALYVHHKTGIKGSAFNPYVGIPDYVRGAKRSKHIKDNFHIHAVVGDPISSGVVPIAMSPSVHLYTPSSSYANVAHALVKDDVAKAGSEVGTLHGITQFTTEGKYGQKVSQRDMPIHDFSKQSVDTKQSPSLLSKEGLKQIPGAFKDTGHVYNTISDYSEGIPVFHDFMKGAGQTTTGIGELASGHWKTGGQLIAKGVEHFGASILELGAFIK